MCALTLKKIGDADIEGKGALVNKCKGEVKHSRFVLSVLFEGHLGLFRHFRFRKAADVAHFSYTDGYVAKV